MISGFRPPEVYRYLCGIIGVPVYSEIENVANLIHLRDRILRIKTRIGDCFFNRAA